jgi:hypothetical protein
MDDSIGSLLDRVNSLEQDTLSLLPILSRILHPDTILGDGEDAVRFELLQAYTDTLGGMIKKVRDPMLENGPSRIDLPPATPLALLDCMDHHKQQSTSVMDIPKK